MPGGGIFVETHPGYPPFQTLHSHFFFSGERKKLQNRPPTIASENQMWSKLLVSSHHSCFETFEMLLDFTL